MPEKVSILFPIPTDTKDTLPLQMARQGIEIQSYPTTLTEIIEIQYVSSAPGSHAAALNAAKEAATGTYIAHCAMGVQWDSSKLERQVAHLEANPDATTSIHYLTMQTETGQTQKNTCESIQKYGAKIGSLLSPPWAPGATMLTQEAAKSLGAFRSIDDTLWEYALRQISRQTAPQILEEDLAIWRSDPANGSKASLIVGKPKYRFLKAYIDKTETSALFSEHALASEVHGHLVRNALYQNNDDLDTAHQICQELGQQTDLPEISYWHGIIHRREPDFNNARSWFQKTQHMQANQAIYQATYQLLQRAIQMPDYGDAREIALQFLRHLQNQDTWDALYFLDLCETAEKEKNKILQKLLIDIQNIEFQTLFQWTFQKATQQTI